MPPKQVKKTSTPRQPQSGVGEAQCTRLARERQAEIAKFLPVRDRFRANLEKESQRQQDEQAQIDRYATMLARAMAQQR